VRSNHPNRDHSVDHNCASFTASARDASSAPERLHFTRGPVRTLPALAAGLGAAAACASAARCV
jgi:hypothetical protein